MKISDLKDYKVVTSNTPVSIPKEKTPFVNKVANFVGAKGITEQFGADIARARAPQEQKALVEYPSQKEVIGSAIQTGANLIPGVGKGVGTLGKIGAGLGTGYAMDVGSKIQTGQEQPLKPGVGTAVGGALPVAGAIAKPVTKIVGRLFKGLGSGLSGVSTENIDTILKNPQTAQKVSERLAKSGNDKILEENAKTIVNGVSKVRQEARKAFGEGLESLSKEDIKPTTFKESISKTLDKYGSSVEGGKRTLGNVEFTDPKNLEKASKLVDEFQTVKLDGKSLRKLADDIENAKYKTATSDERLSFNAFVKDLSNSLRESISNSTGKLDEINQKFSQDLQLTEAVEDIFGNVNFKSLPEVAKAANKLEGLFNEKGLDPRTIDDFLNRIGVGAEDFRTSEAVRQISNKTSGANTKGLSIGEVIQQATSAVVTPQMVKEAAIKIGMSEKKIIPFLRQMSPAGRKLLIQTLLQVQTGNQE